MNGILGLVIDWEAIAALAACGAVAVSLYAIWYSRDIGTKDALVRDWKKWRATVDEDITLFRRKFQKLRDAHGLDTSIDDQ